VSDRTGIWQSKQSTAVSKLEKNLGGICLISFDANRSDWPFGCEPLTQFYHARLEMEKQEKENHAGREPVAPAC
jgi:hypothetical protein